MNTNVGAWMILYTIFWAIGLIALNAIAPRTSNTRIRRGLWLLMIVSFIPPAGLIGFMWLPNRDLLFASASFFEGLAAVVINGSISAIVGTLAGALTFFLALGASILLSKLFKRLNQDTLLEAWTPAFFYIGLISIIIVCGFVSILSASFSWSVAQGIAKLDYSSLAATAVTFLGAVASIITVLEAIAKLKSRVRMG